MDKFYKWLVENATVLFDVLEDSGFCDLEGTADDLDEIPKQMLIGWMYEYLQDKGIEWFSEIGGSATWTTDKHYDELEHQIGKI